MFRISGNVLINNSLDSSQTSPWIMIASSLGGSLDIEQPHANLDAHNFEIFFISIPSNLSNPDIIVTILFPTLRNGLILTFRLYVYIVCMLWNIMIYIQYTSNLFFSLSALTSSLLIAFSKNILCFSSSSESHFKSNLSISFDISKSFSNFHALHLAG